jgi:hypothetical protein
MLQFWEEFGREDGILKKKKVHTNKRSIYPYTAAENWGR